MPRGPKGGKRPADVIGAAIMVGRIAPGEIEEATPPPDDGKDPTAKFTLSDSLRPPCSQCGRPLLLTRIEPEEPGFDLRMYYCVFCATNESIIAPINRPPGVDRP